MLILIRSKKYRRTVRKKIKTGVTIALFFVFTPFLVYWLVKSDAPVAPSVPTKVTLAKTNEGHTFVDAAVQQRVAVTEQNQETVDISAISDATSEINGRWHGLCRKNTIQSVEDFQKTVATDPVLSRHFAGFNWETAKIGKLNEETLAFVTHRKGESIKPTAKPIKLPKGDGYITDGVRTARTYCCNDISLMPSAGLPKKEVEIASEFPVVATPSDVYYSNYTPPGSSDNPPDVPPYIPPYTPPDDPQPEKKEDPSPSPVPEPGTLLLMGTGLLALAALYRKKSGQRR